MAWIKATSHASHKVCTFEVDNRVVLEKPDKHHIHDSAMNIKIISFY